MFGSNKKFGRSSCPPIIAMKKLGVLLLVSSIEYFDHLLVKNYAGNGFVKSLFFSLSQLKSANINTRNIPFWFFRSWTQQHFPKQHWIFQQDSATAHRAKWTQQWCAEHFPDFITAGEWPPYSPNLNPMDYSIWSIMESRACAK